MTGFSHGKYDELVWSHELGKSALQELLEKNGEVFRFSSFEYLDIDWQVIMSRQSEYIILSLRQSKPKDLSGFSMCEFQLFPATSIKRHVKRHRNPVQVSTIRLCIPVNSLKRDCVANDVWTVLLTMRRPIHEVDAQTETETMEYIQKKSIQGLLTLSENIKNMDASKFSDVILKVGRDTFPAHKVILSSRSKVFNGMFQIGMKESQEGVVTIVNMKSSTVKEMLNYIYTGGIEELSVDRAIDLYNAADRYDLQELLEWCRDFLVKNVSAEYLCPVAVLADLQSDKDLTNAVRNFFKEKCKEVLMSEGWKDFAKNHLDVYTRLVEASLLSGC